MSDTDARLWHPWLRINRVLRVMLRNAMERGGMGSGQSRVQEGARAAERDPATRGGATDVLARPRAEKKRQRAKTVQPPLPGMPPPEPPGTARVLPMQLQVGD